MDPGNKAGNDDGDDDEKGIPQKLEEIWRFVLEKINHDHDSSNNVSANDKDLPSSTTTTTTTTRKPFPSEPDKQRFQQAYNATFQLVGDMVDAIVQDGLHAYHQLDQTKEQVAVLKETVNTKVKELERLRETDANHRKTIENLWRAIGKTKTDTQAASQDALVETQLRSQLAEMTRRTEQAVTSAEMAQQKRQAVDDELSRMKAKVAQLERDQRAVSSWAKSVDHHVSSDTDFYKRKVRTILSVSSIPATCTSIVCF